jgi:hypothetical protein
LGIHDVKWSHGQFSTHIATAAANGKVVLYDLNRVGVELARLHEHTRQVHKLAFNPHQGYLLLSASHDSTVRLWDLRAMRKDIMTCRSRDQYLGMNGGIRDVQWSPTDALEFAFGTDNGTIQRWDFRHAKGPKQKITAHDQRMCTSIDWHPDGKHLLSAGVDKTVKVWDFSVDGRRQKPAFVLTTPYPVHKARWRPPYWSDEYHEKGAYQCTQMVTSYDRDHPMIHVWDFRRPYLPLREINRSASAPSDLLWHSRDTLWTVGREGVFQQYDVHHAPKVVNRRNLQAFAVSLSGEIGGVTQKRPRRGSGVDYSTDDTYTSDKHSSPEKSSFRNSAGDNVDDSFLSSSFKRHHGRTASNRSAKSFGSIPPSESALKVMLLTDSMAIQNDRMKPNQFAFRGTLPGAMNVQIFAYLAQKYKAIPLTDPPTLQSYLDLRAVFEQNAEYAQRAAFYRLAENWRIIGAAIAIATRRRAELHRKQRHLPPKSMASAPSNVKSEPTTQLFGAHDQQLTVPNIGSRAILGPSDELQSNQSPHQLPSTNESTSNLATPLARPLTASTPNTTDTQQLSDLPDPDQGEHFKLPPAAAGTQSSGIDAPELPIRVSPSPIQGPISFNEPQWSASSKDVDERRAMIGSWRAPPRAPLSLEPTTTQGLNIKIPPRLDRHNSDDSFAMFSASTDSQRGASMPSSYASGKSQPRSMKSIPEKWQHELADSRFENPESIDENNTSARRPAAGASFGNVPKLPTTLPIGKVAVGAGLGPDQGAQYGSAREDSAPPVEYGSREKAVEHIGNLRRNNQLLRHDSSESEAYASSRGDLSTSSVDYSVDMAASGTIIPESQGDIRSPQAVKLPPSLTHATESAPPVLEPTAEDPLMLPDFQAMHVDAEEGSAFTVAGLLKSVLAFHTSTLSDAQTSSFLLLLLAPLLPQTHNLSGPSDFDIAAVFSNFQEALAASGLTPTQTDTVLQTELKQLLATGINPYQAEAILHTYHAQLHSLSLFNPAASLRRLAYPTYPAVYEQALKDTQIGLLCLSCKSPINNPKDKMRCETCKRAQAPCPICWGRYPVFGATTAKKKAKYRSAMKEKDHGRKHNALISCSSPPGPHTEDRPSPSVPDKLVAPMATLWSWCPLCGHGGHTNCLSTWFADPILSDGACATEGCLCDCVRGRRREEKIKQILAKKADKERSRMVKKGDDWKVGESKAVSAVRTSLGDASSLARDASSTEVPSSAAGAGGGAVTGGSNLSGQGLVPPGLPRREDARRVRIMGPQNESDIPGPV